MRPRATGVLLLRESRLEEGWKKPTDDNQITPIISRFSFSFASQEILRFRCEIKARMITMIFLSFSSLLFFFVF
jgi:hypothetical protein